MKRLLSALACCAAVAAMGIPAAHAEPVPASSAPTSASPEVTPREQFQFLGYTVSERAISGTGSSSDRTQVERFQSKFGLKQTGTVNPATLKALGKYAGDTQIPKRCRTGEWTLCVNKFNRTVMAVNGDGTVAKTMDARFGGPGYFSREGSFEVFRKGGRNHISTLYRVEMPYPLFYSGGQAIHFSWEFSRFPHTQSHGCVGTRDLKAQKWLWDRSPVGTPVIVLDRAPKPV